MHFATAKGSLSVIDWPFPGTLQDVWGTLLSARQLEIALDCASTAERRNIPVTTRLLANALNRRAQEVLALGPQELARNIVTFAATEPDALDEIFRVYFSFRHKKMVARFLEQLQLQTDGLSDRSQGSKQGKVELESAISSLLREFRHDDVMLYTQVLSCQNPTFWSELSRVNFKTIDAAARNSEPVEPPVRTSISRSSLRAAVAPVADPPSGDEPMRTAQELQSDLKELSERFSRTADELQSTILDLRAGKLPSSVDETLAALGPAFAKLVYDVCARTSQLGIDRTGEAFHSINDLAPAITAIEEKEKALADAERVTRLLAQVQELTTLNGRDFQPLESLKESARALQQELAAASGSPDAASEDRLHAFELVLKMVDSTAGEDENAEEVVAEQFGAKLLYALGTGKIVRGAASQPETQSASAATDAPALTGMEMLLEAAATSKVDAYSSAAAVNVAQTDVA